MVSVSASDLSVTLGRRTVVRGVSATLKAGALVGILGPNGAGKSSLVRALLGLLPHGGAVSIDGVPRASLSRGEIARRVAYLPQGQLLHWPVSVERLVALGRLPHLGPFSRIGAADRAAIDRAMARAEVGALADRVATELSGGERARVLLARALAVEAPVLVADEPLASLDPAHQIEGMELLRAEADAGGLVVAVLHDLTLAARFCDRVLVMADGALVADGPPAAVLTPALLAEVYGITATVTGGERPLLVPLDRVPLTGRSPPA
ncbi:ABC transporter ATP-binding protein [Sphingomonas rubra]|uniref:Iron complex transport system ATP-binding protein n=1 Tax=Sphingomonas rubra TaxID=634430 RepID=A0A1I5QH89_9SPHN|nr:ABC transporter ATP-binding protein [Sphingomonas rubra]SFP45649.1 iron complex transport system ATP-binding protein [Sphingomonas rubra]